MEMNKENIAGSEPPSNHNGKSKSSGKKKGRTGKKKKDEQKINAETSKDADHPAGSLKIVIIIDPKDLIRLLCCGGKCKSSISCKCAPKEPDDVPQTLEEHIDTSESSGCEGDVEENLTRGLNGTSGKSKGISSSNFSTTAVIEKEFAISDSISDAERTSDMKFCNMCKTWFHQRHTEVICKMSQLQLGSDNERSSDGHDITDVMPYCDKCQMWMKGQQMQSEDTSADDLDRPSQGENVIQDTNGQTVTSFPSTSNPLSDMMIYCHNCQMWFSECIIQDGEEKPFTVSAECVINVEDTERARRVASDASISSNALIYCPLCQTWLENYILQDSSTV